MRTAPRLSDTLYKVAQFSDDPALNALAALFSRRGQ
jgi:hypothetical protein